MSVLHYVLSSRRNTHQCSSLCFFFSLMSCHEFFAKSFVTVIWARNQNSVTQIALFCMTDTVSVLRSNNTERIYVTFNMQADDFWFFSTRNRRSIVWPEYRQYPSLAVWQSIQYGIKGKSMYDKVIQITFNAHDARAQLCVPCVTLCELCG